MNISKENIDDLNAVVKVDIKKGDYQPKVDKILKDYRKTANIPGFRKGRVPMGLVKKQYGQAVLVDEVNKLLQESLNTYITEEKLDILGNPIPKERQDFSWGEENYTFEFELGLAPDFEVDINTKEPVTYHKITPGDKMIDEQIERIQMQYGKIKSKNKAEEGDQITGVLTNEEKEIENETTIFLDQVESEESKKKIIGSKVGDNLELNTKGLVKEDSILANHLGLDEEEVKDLDATVNLEVKEINVQELAELNEELFSKVFGEDEDIKTEEDFRKKIEEDITKQFVQQGDQQLLNDLTEALIDKTEFDLPDEFLKKWIQISGEKELSSEEAKEEYQRSEKGLRLQLIENKLLEANDIKVEADDVREFAKERLKMQMAQFGQMNLSDEELDNIAQRVMSNEDEARNMSEQVKNEKLIKFYKEHANLEEKEITYDDFVKEVMG